MWVCPKCKTQNHDSLGMCWWCHTEPDGTEHPDMKAIGVPRQFSVGRLLFVVSMFVVLFAILTMLGATIVIFCGTVIFILGIGIVQIVDYWKNPSVETIIAGLIFGVLICMAAFYFDSIYPSSVWVARHGLPTITVNQAFAIAIGLFGGVFGYFAGCLIAGIFLVRVRGPAQEKNDEAGITNDEGMTKDKGQMTKDE
jgi:uncharacterized membrane protein (UPF0136 family)